MKTAQDLDDFVKLVAEMRRVQKRYFRTRAYDALHEAQALEKRVDGFLREYAGNSGEDGMAQGELLQ